LRREPPLRDEPPLDGRDGALRDGGDERGAGAADRDGRS
jgi:hypothetical protein